MSYREPRAARLARAAAVAAAAATLAASLACRDEPAADRVRVSGYVEATEIRIAPEVGGRLLELRADEGDRVKAGDTVAQLDTADVTLALRRAAAERQAADAQLRLLQAGARAEDIRQAEAQHAAAEADLAAARREFASAERDLQRFDSLLAANSGAEKPRDDAQTRRDVTRDRVRAGEARARAAAETVARLRAGARREEIDAARARLAAADAQIATLDKALKDATVLAPAAGVVTQKLVDAGELIAPRTPILVVADLDRVWANVYVDEPLVPRVTLGQSARVFTDAGGPGIDGTVTFISPKAEFTPRNVQTAEERSKLVFRVKITVDNRSGVLKQGMPVEAEIPLKEQAPGAGR
ncbi:MAG TPA: efflux RND transporter periplasmic adaptor subunit [Vicinamibacterales bacterium]|nr:efflux RND transporter periplasmic adaptor subunit [Vicinamibacterales bacterium]HPW20686.1 efflux RND transporter periplasmic adaptor subunit [Vicinamibacterales bacterium]